MGTAGGVLIVLTLVLVFWLLNAAVEVGPRHSERRCESRLPPLAIHNGFRTPDPGPRHA
jgi:hypothetical protein